MALARTGIHPWEEIRQVVMLVSPDDVALERTILMALGGWLPLDHDGLIGAATSDDCLRGGTGGLLGESQSAEARSEKERAR